MKRGGTMDIRRVLRSTFRLKTSNEKLPEESTISTDGTFGVQDILQSRMSKEGLNTISDNPSENRKEFE